MKEVYLIIQKTESSFELPLYVVSSAEQAEKDCKHLTLVLSNLSPDVMYVYHKIKFYD